MNEGRKSAKLPLLYILGLPIILILATDIARMKIYLGVCPLYLNSLIYPLTYLITMLIIKKSDSKSATKIMAVSILSVALSFIINGILLGEADYMLMICTFLSFMIGQSIIIYFYKYLLEHKMDTYLSILILVLVVSIADNIFYGGLIEGNIINLTIFARMMYVIIITAVVGRPSKKKEITTK